MEAPFPRPCGGALGILHIGNRIRSTTDEKVDRGDPDWQGAVIETHLSRRRPHPCLPC